MTGFRCDRCSADLPADAVVADPFGRKRSVHLFDRMARRPDGSMFAYEVVCGPVSSTENRETK